MKIGVTGTREGATDAQLTSLIEYMSKLGSEHELHHGDCRGVDVQVAVTARELGWKIVCHPPEKSEQRGYFGGDIIHPELDYLTRDRKIVDETEILMVVPLQSTPQKKSGTWYTHDYAVQKRKPLRIFYPDGTISNPISDEKSST